MTTDIGVRITGTDAELIAALNRSAAAVEGFAQRAGGAVKSIKPPADEANSALGGLKDTFVSFAVGGTILGAFKVVAGQVADVAVELLNSQIAADKLRNTLRLTFGEAGAARETAYLRQVTRELGQEFGSSAQSYAKLAAAARGTNLEGRETREIFEAVSSASTVMGLSVEQNQGALLAITQIMSKGTVQAEELRGQLGERLPGAFQIAARAMGVTTAELGKMLEQGQVISDDFLPKFAAQLKKELGDSTVEASNSAQASVNRLSNAWEALKESVARSGVGDFIKGQVDVLGDGLGNVTEKVNAAREAGGGFLSQFGAALAAYAQFANPLNAVSYSALEAGNRLKEAEARLAELQALMQNPTAFSTPTIVGKAIAETQVLIGKLQEAQREQRALASPAPSQGDFRKLDNQGVAARAEAESKLRIELDAISQRLSGQSQSFNKDLKKLYEGYTSGAIKTEKEYIDKVKSLIEKDGGIAKAPKASGRAQSISEALDRRLAEAQAEAQAQEKISVSEKFRVDTLSAIKAALDRKTISVAKAAAEEEKLYRVVELLRENEGRAALQSIRDFTAQNQQELAEGEKLTEGQKRALVVLNDLRTGKLKLSEASTIALGAELENALAVEKSTIAQRELDKQLEKDGVARVKSFEALEASTDKLLEEIEAQKKSNNEAFLGAAAVQELEVARLRDAAAIAEQTANTADLIDPSRVLGNEYRRQAEALRELAGERAKGVQATAAKEALEEWKRTSDAIDGVFRDTFRGLFTGGDNVFSAFGKSLKTTVATAVADAFYSATIKSSVNDLANYLGQALGQGAAGAGGGGAAGGAGGGGGGALSALNSISSLTGLGSIGASFTGSVGSGVALTLGEGFAGTIAAVEAGFTAVASGSGAAIAAGFGQIAGALGPYALAALAIYELTKSKGGPKTESSFDTGYDSLSRAVNDERGAKQLSDSIESAYAQLAQTLGLAVKDLQVGVFTSIDTIGDALTQLQVVARDAGAEIYNRGSRLGGDGTGATPGGIENVGRTDEELQAAIAEETTRVLLAALQQSDLPQKFKDYIAAQGNVDAALATVVGVRQLDQALESLGGGFAQIAQLSVQAEADFANLFGGVQGFAQSLGSYYQNFYTEAERVQRTTDSLAQTFAELGLALPTSREGFRALVDQQLALGASGAETVAQLLKLEGVFASIARDSEDIAALQQQLLVATGNTAELRRQELAGLGPLGRALQQRLFALADEKDALEALTQAQSRLTTANSGLVSSLSVLRNFGASLRGNLAGALDSINQLRGQALSAVEQAAQGNQTALQALKAYNDTLAGQIAQNSASITQLRTTAQQNLLSAESAVQTALQALRSQSEQDAQALTQATDAVAQAQDRLTGSIEAIANAVSTAAGVVASAQQDVVAAQAQITQAYQQALKDRDAVAGDIAAALTGASDAYAAAQQRVIDLQREAGNSLRAFASDIQTYLRGLTTSDLSASATQSRPGAARAVFDDLAARAAGGDVQARGQLTGAADVLLRSIKEFGTSFDQLEGAEIRVRQVLGRLAGGAAGQAGGPAAADDPQAQAQQAVADALAKLQEIQGIATAAGVTATDTTRDLLADYTAAAERLDAAAADVLESGASYEIQQASLLGAYSAAQAALGNAQAQYDNIVSRAAASGFDATVRAAADGLDQAIAGAVAAQTELAQANAQVAAAQAASAASAAAYSVALGQAQAVNVALANDQTTLAALVQQLTDSTAALSDARAVAIAVEADKLVADQTLLQQYAGLTAAASALAAEQQSIATGAAALGVNVAQIATTVETANGLLQRLGVSQLDLLQAQTIAQQVQAELFAADDTLVARYGTLQAQVASYTSALADFEARVEGIDFSALDGLDPLADLIATFAGAVTEVVAAQQALAAAQAAAAAATTATAASNDGLAAIGRQLAQRYVGEFAVNAVDYENNITRDAALDVEGGATASQINAIYVELLGRNADSARQASAIAGQIDAGNLTIAQFRNSLVNSVEYLARSYGSEVLNAFHLSVSEILGLNTAPQVSVPSFADGGSFAGGIRLVGETGMELENTGPSRIFSAGQTSDILGGATAGSAEMLAELRALRRDIASLDANNGSQNRSMQLNLLDINNRLGKWDIDGLPEEREALTA